MKPHGGSILIGWTYDALGRLVGADETGADESRTGGQSTTPSRSCTTRLATVVVVQFVELSGSILAMGEPAVGVTTLSYSRSDRDRICHITFENW
jgi:hypothetical protein